MIAMDIFSEIFGDIWHDFDMMSYAPQTREEPHCPKCGSTLSDIRKSGRLGCGECYSAFRPTIEATLKQIHQNTDHTGKIPSKAGKELKAKRHLEVLKKQLQEAVNKEDYESAAKIHKEIKAMEQD